MNEEEIEAIKELRMMKEINLSFTSYAWCNGNVRLSEGQKHTIDTILNLIKKQQQELQLKDKLINELVYEVSCFIPDTEEHLKQYFINKVKGE